MLKTKIIGILMALTMFSGLGAIAADTAAPVAANCHQKVCKNTYMPVKDPKGMHKDKYKHDKDPRMIWKHSCNPIWKHSMKHSWKHSWKHSCNPIWKHSCNPPWKHSCNPIWKH